MNNYHLIEFNGDKVIPQSILDHCVIEGSSRGSVGIRVDNVYNTQANKYPTIRNTTVKNCTGYAVYVANSYPLLENNTYINNGSNEVFYQ